MSAAAVSDRALAYRARRALVKAWLDELLASVERSQRLADDLLNLLPPQYKSRRHGDVSMARFELARARRWAEFALRKDTTP